MAYDYAYLRYQDPNYGKLVNEAPRQVFQVLRQVSRLLFRHLPDSAFRRPPAGAG